MSIQRQNKTLLEQIPKTSVFRVPEGYFLSLPLSIQTKLLADNPVFKTTVFLVLEGYFESLPITINAKLPVKLSASGLKTSPFKAPEHYFEKLPSTIQTPESIREKLPLNNTQESVHGVPEDYFDRLPYQIQEKINKKKVYAETPVYLRPAFQYSMAAGLVLALLVSVTLYIRTQLSTEQTTIASHTIKEDATIANTLIANLSKEEIKTYLEHQENLEVHQLLEYSSLEKKEKIKKEFEKELLKDPLNAIEKKDIETELNNIDLTELDAEI